MTLDENDATRFQAETDESSQASDDLSSSESDSDQKPEKSADKTHKEKMEEWASRVEADTFEKWMLQNVVNTDSIPPDYKEIFINPSIIRKLEHTIALSLQRPKAFGHGILKGNRITGAVLYGPPGSGKTMLCRSLAKQSGLNMLAITPAEIWHCYVGQTEKAVKAIFSVARKISPCIIFIDEADALFPSRRSDDQRHTRNMFNLFLTEWDGLMTDLTSPFVLLATNRPCDLDPAALRRAPVQIHLEMPGAKERAGILGVLLKDETLGSDITISKLVELTPHYTGSDLKNLCVAAAIESVQEQRKDTWSRILMERHFLSALGTVGATKMNKAVKSQARRFKADSK